MKQNNPTTNLIVTAILVGLVAGGGGFFGGTKFQQNKRTLNPTMMMGGQGRMGAIQNGANMKNASRPLAGEIIKADGKSITVKSRDGSSKIVLLSETGQIYKTASGSATDLQIGVQVSVFGSSNPDGSVTAQNIQISSAANGIVPKPESK